MKTSSRDQKDQTGKRSARGRLLGVAVLAVAVCGIHNGNAGSSYALNTPPGLAIPVHHILNRPPHSGSSYILNTPRRLAMLLPMQHIYIYIYVYILNTPPHLAIPVFIYLKHAPSFGDSGSSHILHTPPHVAIPVHHRSLDSREPQACYVLYIDRGSGQDQRAMVTPQLTGETRGGPQGRRAPSLKERGNFAHPRLSTVVRRRQGREAQS